MKMEFTPGVANTCPNELSGAACQIFLTLTNALMSMTYELGPEGRYPPDYSTSLKDGDEFDFIVVGAGSAGCVVANRLSEVPQWKVLLLEAGGYPSAVTEIPGLSGSLQDTNEDWQYNTEPSKTCCLGLKNKRCRCPRGKALGGTSLLNTMFYTRSTRYDHDIWANNGNDGWDYDSVLSYYKKHENAHIENNIEYGTDGELHLTQIEDTEPVSQILNEAYQELGYGKYSEDKPIGFKSSLMSIYKGRRMSSSKAFLTPIKNRTNLMVAINARVSKLLLEDNKLSVNGVQVKINNKLMNIKSKREVILSAGGINSPVILMNSGIGPKEHLTDLGIKIVKDLKVGGNMQDHFSLGVFISLNESLSINDVPSLKGDYFYQFLMHKQGPLATNGILSLLAYVDTHNKTSNSNVQFFHKAIAKDDKQTLNGFIHGKGFPQSVAKTLASINHNSSLLIIMPMLLRPKSNGYVRLQNSDPFSKPLIIPNYLSDKGNDDAQVMLDSIRFIQKLISTKAFAKYDPQLVSFDVDDCKTHALDSDNFWICAIRNLGSTSFHPVGTCKMGPINDREMVVNPRLQVHGIRGVRVIDGSIMPTIVSANPNGPIMMIGEKGAALIKKDLLKSIRMY